MNVVLTPRASARAPSHTNPAVLLARHAELRVPQDDYNINVTANFGTRLEPADLWREIAAHPGDHEPAHLYFHIPLCGYVCSFCNYVKRLAPTGALLDKALDDWTRRLLQESELYRQQAPWLGRAPISSIFLGGGTASLLRRQHLEAIISHVRARYVVAPHCEITLEGNPDNFLNDEIANAVALGFNRFSVGVQSLDSVVNRFAGRGHDSVMSLMAIRKLIDAGRPFNVDLMFGLPRQTPESVAEDVRTLTGLRVPTITIYRLRNADREAMGIGNRAAWNAPHVRERLSQDSVFPALAETYAMRAAMVDALLAAGYRPSPCGWWSAPGTYPNGNIPQVSRDKWQNYATMIGFGPGAYGWLAGARPAPIQTHNIADIASYARHMDAGAAGPPLAYGRRLEGPQAVATALGFAFKANQPIDLRRFQALYGVDLSTDEPYASVLCDLIAADLLQRDPEDAATVIPTLDGETLHEEIISIYIHDRIGNFSASVCHR